MKTGLFIALFLTCLTTKAQIPAEWHGHYGGTLHVQQLSGATAAYHMEFVFTPVSDSIYDWTIIYGEDSLRQERKYQLIQTGKNQYDIDEKNSIVLSNNLIQNRFISTFEVQGNLIHFVYQFEKDRVMVDVTSSSGKTETGNTETGDAEDAEIPIVYTYQTSTIQTAVLDRIKSIK